MSKVVVWDFSNARCMPKSAGFKCLDTRDSNMLSEEYAATLGTLFYFRLLPIFFTWPMFLNLQR